jgi:hypothetical protein
VHPGQRVERGVTLDPLAATGFTLVSDPPGAQAVLDGRALDGLTPLQVQSVAPGKHKIQVTSSAGSWTQDVTLEPGKTASLHATLTHEAPAAAAALPAVPAAAAVVATRVPEAAAAAPAPGAAPHPHRPAPPAPRDPPSRPAAAREPPRQAVERPARVAPKKSDDGDDGDRAHASAAVERSAQTAPAADAPTSDRAAPGEGFLRLGSKPWTTIAVDGRDTGLHTPQTHIKLSAGVHRVTLSNAQFSIKETFSVDIKPGATETVIKDLRSQNADND